MQNPSQWTLALRSLRFFRKTHAALALGIAAATAVIVGALVVGDSVRGSLRKVVTDRLANIECLLHARVYFSPEILKDLAENETNTHVTPGIIFDRTTVEFRDDGNVSRTAGVQLLAMDDSFWSHIELPVDAPSIGEDEVALNASLANDLGVAIGDEISVRVEQLGGVPGDNPLGDRDDRSVNVPRQKVVAILPDQSVGGVSFLSSQSV